MSLLILPSKSGTPQAIHFGCGRRPRWDIMRLRPSAPSEVKQRTSPFDVS
jgi:hypothetical protein